MTTGRPGADERGTVNDINPLRALQGAGQSIWLDFLRRGLITGGGLARLIDEDGVTGVTSNPTIFARAIVGSSDYDDAIARIARQGDASPLDVFYDLALSDIRMAADLFAPVYDRTAGADGFVSFELEARLAHDARGSIAAARELVARIGRPNVMIKIPGTTEGVEVIEELTAAGINVNVTLLFSVEMYWQAAMAYGAWHAAGPLAGWHRWRRSSSPGSTRWSTRCCPMGRPCADGSPSPTPSGRTGRSSTFSPVSAGPAWPRPAPECNARSGPPPGRRTRPIRTSSTSRNSSGATR
jgi:hypothetical protein